MKLFNYNTCSISFWTSEKLHFFFGLISSKFLGHHQVASSKYKKNSHMYLNITPWLYTLYLLSGTGVYPKMCSNNDAQSEFSTFPSQCRAKRKFLNHLLLHDIKLTFQLSIISYCKELLSIFWGWKKHAFKHWAQKTPCL